MSESDEFFLNSDSEQLKKIHGWARARGVSPWAVLFGVLLRVSASVPPNVQLPAVIGGRASLNLLCAFVGRSGMGKGNTAKVAELAWPGEILTRPLGSGQGIAEAFTKRSETDEIVPVIFDVPEVDTLSALTKTQGSVLLPTLKSMAMGEQLGQTNATKESSRNVPPHTYRACLSVGVQPGHSSVFFGDTSGGTPQRFLWVRVGGPDVEFGSFEDPAALATDMPAWAPASAGVVEIKYECPEIAPAIRAAQLAAMREEADALDGHALLTRCKVAALLAVMHGRIEVKAWDWDVSGKFMEVSDRTRAWLLQQEGDIRAAAIRERGKNDALRSEGRVEYEHVQLESVKATIVTTLSKLDGTASGSDVNMALGKSHRRKLRSVAVAELIEDGRIEEIEVPRGVRYRLVDPVQGEQAVQGASVQVTEDERGVQGDQSAVVISMDDRRSQTAADPKPSCLKWFDGHLAEQRAQGHDVVESVSVRAAGEAAGYTKNQLYVAANQRGYKGTHWELTG